MSAEPFSIHQIEQNSGIIPAITCIVCHSARPLDDRTIKRWSSPLWIVDYIWTPCVPTRVGSQRRPWRAREANTAHLYPPDTFFWEDFREAKPGMIGMGFFLRGGALAGLDRLIQPGQCYAKFYDPEGKLGDILRRLSNLPEQLGQRCFPALQSSMWDVIHTLLTATHMQHEDYRVEKVHRLETQETFSMQVESHMRSHFREKLSLESIAEALNVSTATLRSKFVKEKGTSPMARLTAIRIDIAKNSLLRGEKLRDIAARTGFFDEFHLSKAFKRITGQSPREFLRSLKG